MKTMILAAVAMTVVASAALADEPMRPTDAQLDRVTAGVPFTAWVATRPLAPLPEPIAIVAPEDFGALSNRWFTAQQTYAGIFSTWFGTGPLFDVD